MIEAHVWLAHGLARRHYERFGRLLPLDELDGEAVYALVYAADRFDEGRGVPFGAYATLVVRHRLNQAVSAWRRGGRLAHTRFTDLTAAGPEPDRRFDVACHRTRAGDDEAAVREALARVRAVVRPRWYRALHLYHAQGHTLEEVGAILGVSRERVRQMVGAAINQARRRFPDLIDGRPEESDTLPSC